MKYSLIALLIITALFLYLKKTSMLSDAEIKKIKTSSSDYIGIDVRSDFEIRINKADGSIHIPLDKIQSSDLLPEDKNKKILVFCESGARSNQALKILKTMGYSNVENIGDWRTWQKITQD